MMLAQPNPISTRSFHVRVLGEPKPAVSQLLGIGTQADVGYALLNDIVIRDPRVEGRRIRIIFGERLATVELLEGEVRLLGQSVFAPASLLLPPYVPLDLGGLALAYGQPEALEWAQAESLAGAILEPALAPETKDVPRWSALLRMLRRRLAHFRSSLPMAVPAAILVAVGSVLFLLAINTGGSASASSEQITQALRAAGYTQLQVHVQQGRTVISGLLPSDLASARLSALLVSRGLHATLAVTTGDALVREVEDLFNSAGLHVAVRTTPAGTLQISAPAGADPLRLDQLARQARLKAPFAKIEFEPLADRAAEGPSPQITDVTPGPDGYVTTADGSKYFVGATLPTGQTIVAIQTHRIELESSGVNTQLTY
jgi:type III secretion protein D